MDALDHLADQFADLPPAERLQLAADVADRLDVLRAAIDAGEITATDVQAAALFGAVTALRAVTT